MRPRARFRTRRRCFPAPSTQGPRRALPRRGRADASTLSVDYCSGCGICSQVCPQGVKIAEINAQARDKLKRQKGIPLRDRIITRPTWLGRLGTPVAPLANWTLRLTAPCGSSPRSCWEFTATHRSAASQGAASRAGRAAHASPPAGRTVVYFHGCGTEYYEPWEGERVVAVLEHNGFEVIVPKQDCCGLPLQSSGLFDDARRVVKRLARRLAQHLSDDRTRSSSATPPAAR